MSKTSVNNTAVKPDSVQVKKEIRTSSGSTPTAKDEKRSSDGYTNQQQKNNSSSQTRAGQSSHGHRPNQQHAGDSRNSRDQSGNRNDSRHFEKTKSEAKGGDDAKTKSETVEPVGEKKFTGRCRLFVGNLTPDITEDDFRKLFEVFGEVSEIYLNPSRGFGFIRLDYRQNAEAAKAGLDGVQRKGRVLRVRFATHGAALKVRNLHPFVSNELLEHSFSQFGELERCVVIVDDRGKSTGEGIVEFVRKPGANSALRRITEGVFLMGMDPKPISVEPLEHKDEEDGLPEKLLTRTEQYKKEREVEPRFALPGTFEFEFGMRWKQLEELEKQRIEQVKKDIEDARLKLEDEMQNALFEYQADQIRQELARQQEELRRLEELRNQDRLRRQQEYELRHQQEERERAQQEERRRADAMMIMRQQELARGRSGPMDIPVITGRQEMMVTDRFTDRMPDYLPDRMGDRMPERIGDRMPERMGDRMPERMGDRMPERMGDRMPERMGDRMPERVGDRLPDRMGDRLPDRMGDRMPDRMNERMSSNQPGFLWDEKQRAEATPQPLMQATTGFGNLGGPPGGGPGSSAAGLGPGPSASDSNSMDQDCTEDTSLSKSEDSQETNVSDLPSDDLGKHEVCLATFRSPDFGSESKDHEPQAGNSASSVDAENNCTDTGMHVDVLDGNPGLADRAQDANLPAVSSSETMPHASSIPASVHEVDSSNPASPFSLDDPAAASKLATHSDYHHHPLAGADTSASQPCDSSFSTPEVLCKKLKSSDVIDVASTGTDTSYQNSCSKTPYTHMAVDGSQSATHSFDCRTVRDSQNDSFDNQMVVSVSDNCLTNSSELVSYGQNELDGGGSPEAVDDQDVSVGQNSPLDNRVVHCPEVVHPQTTASLECLSSNIPVQYSPAARSPSHHREDEISHFASHTGSTLHNDSVVTAEADIGDKSNCLPGVSVENSCHANQNSHISHPEPLLEGSGCLQTLLKEDPHDPATRESHIHSPVASLVDSGCTHSIGDYSADEDDKLSSYRQHISHEAEEMDTEVVDDDDGADVTVNSSVYQSYEDDLGVQYETTAAAATGLIGMPMVAQYDTTDSQLGEIHPSADVSSDVTDTCSSEVNSDEASSSAVVCVPLQDTVTDAATSSTEDVTTSTSPSSLSLSAHQTLGSDQERMFVQGEQAFISARQAASVPFMPAGCSMPYVPGINPSMYAGAAMVQGLAGPTMLTSSTMHIAQHPGGATIMQHQSMSTGLTGSLSQATVMQQQAMASGVQATSLLQRTLTNGGQTMVVQQRTMTTGLDGVTQQTVVQQQMAAPTMNPAAAALFHANAMRQRTMASQQAASIMQQRSIRLVQAVANPMLHAQTLRGATLIPGGPMTPAALIGHGLLRGGVSQGTMMQQLVRQRYLGGPVMPGRGVQLMAGRPIRVKMTYPRESMPMDT